MLFCIILLPWHIADHYKSLISIHNVDIASFEVNQMIYEEVLEVSLSLFFLEKKRSYRVLVRVFTCIGACVCVCFAR